MTNKKETINKHATYNFETISYCWLESVRPHVKESTAIKYENLLNLYILPSLGSISPVSISYETIDNMCRFLLSSGGVHHTGLSAKTVADCLALVRSIMKHESCVSGINLFTAKSVTVRQTLSSMRILTRSEQNILCRYIKDNPCLKNTGILICLFTGIRIGELCALRWGDISIVDSTLHVCRTMQRLRNLADTGGKTRILITAPKSSCSIRTIPLPHELCRAIARVASAADCYVLTGKSDSFTEPRTMQYHFKKVLRECSIEDTHFHILRHTFATRCIELGFDIKSLSDILGHANVNITMNRYVHPSMELKRKNMNLVSDMMSDTGSF